MRLKLVLVICKILLLSACGVAIEEFDLPEERPTGTIQGKVLGGLYSGGTITAYTLNDADNRQFLASGEVREDGDFILEFAARSQAVLLEVNGGSYRDPSSRQIVNAEPDFVMSTPIKFISGEVHEAAVTPFTHLSSGLILYSNQKNKNALVEPLLSSGITQINELYSIDLTNSALNISFQEKSKVVTIDGNEKHGLLINALSRISQEASVQKDDTLQDQYNLASLSKLMYEDIRADGILNGLSKFNDEGEAKPLAFGEQPIDLNFYRLELALASKKALQYTAFTDFNSIAEQEDFIVSIAQTESDLLGDINSEAVLQTTPLITLKSDVAVAKKQEFSIDFMVENALKLTNIVLKIDEIDSKYNPIDIYNAPKNEYSITIDSSKFNDGTHELSLIVNDSFENIGSLQFPMTFDNSPPTLTVKSAKLTNKSDYTLKGSFRDGYSTVKTISINDQNATISASNEWEKAVELNSGVNEFFIRIDDELGNSNEYTVEVFFDEFAPDITLTSTNLTNSNQFLLEGVFIDGESGVHRITVNGEDASFEDERKWSKLVTLNNGNNEFVIGIEDVAGNYSEFLTDVFLDELAPVITLTSAALTNSSQFLMTGEYIEAGSGVKHISVNGNSAKILADQQWSMPVILNSGSNEFNIKIEDDAGNFSELSTTVYLDKFAPVVKLTSKNLTNSSEFILQGEFAEGESGVKSISINGIATTLDTDQKWSMPVALSSGNNSFLIEIEDDAGNYSEFTTNVFLDDVAPSIVFSDPVQVRYSNNDGTFTQNILELKNNTPLYIEANQLSLAGMQASIENLSNANIPYFSFEINDQAYDDLQSANEDLTLEYRYLINDVEIVPWRLKSIEPETKKLLLPIVSETLSNAWYKVTADDEHVLEIRATDKPGNTTIEQAIFKTQFYIPQLTIQLNEKLHSISDGDFPNRAKYINKEVVAANYRLHNPFNRPFNIRFTDNSIHTVTQQYEEVLRENKVQLRSTELWRRSTITPLEIQCPKLNNDWAPVSSLWNRIGGKWVETFPSEKLEVKEVFTDSPVLPTKNNTWANYQANDQETVTIVNPMEGVTFSYSYDYLFNYTPQTVHAAIRQPGMLKAWALTTANPIDSITCPDIYSIQSKMSYTYLPVENYPRNNLQSKFSNKEFTTSRIKVLDEDNSEIQENAGWFEIPASHTVTIKKYVKTPKFELFTDQAVVNADDIRDYDIHKLDKKFSWQIAQDLDVETQFNPDNVLDSDSNIKQHQLKQAIKNIEFIRR